MACSTASNDSPLTLGTSWPYGREVLKIVVGMVASFCNYGTCRNMAIAMPCLLPFVMRTDRKDWLRALRIMRRYLIIRMSSPIRGVVDNRNWQWRATYGHIGTVPWGNGYPCDDIEMTRPFSAVNLGRRFHVCTFVLIRGYNVQWLDLCIGGIVCRGLRQYYRLPSCNETRAQRAQRVCVYRMPEDGYIRGLNIMTFAFHSVSIMCNPSGRITRHVVFGYQVVSGDEMMFLAELPSPHIPWYDDLPAAEKDLSAADKARMHRKRGLFHNDARKILVEPAYMRVIVLNGPPGSGKDTVADLLAQRGWRKREFKETLHARAQAHYGIDPARWAWLCGREHKDLAAEELGNLTPRQALIHVAENICKAQNGRHAIAIELCASLAADGLRDVVISDCGFPEEVDQLIRDFGAQSILLVRLSRPGCSFDGDSRVYVTDDRCRALDLSNDADVSALVPVILDSASFI